MSFTIGKCDLFKNKRITDSIKKIVQETINTKKEHGFAICIDQKDELFPHETISGTRSRLKYQLRCPKKTEKVGSFHTHTEYEEKSIEPERMFKTRPIPSQTDLLIAIHKLSKEKIGCVGLVSSPKTFDVSCYDTEDILKEMNSPIITVGFLRIAYQRSWSPLTQRTKLRLT